jgi:hypothetical protein
MDNTNDQLAQSLRVTALVTFLLGTAIFLACCFISDKFLWLGYGYIVVAGLVNLSLFSVALGEGIRSKSRKVMLSAGVLLLNIPAMLFYVWLWLVLSDIAWITFTNATAHELTALRVEGCEEIALENMQPGERTTVWISIPHDCSVYLFYQSQGDTVRAVVEGYITPGLGGPMNYNIGGYNDPGEHVW